MARYKLTLAYDGAAFSGSQRQLRRRTVQSELERALRILGWAAAGILLAGRTDAGVHALGQVAAVDVEWRHTPEELRDALNANLPADMAVRAAEVASDRFHPRFDAVARRYRYQVHFQPVRDPLQDRLAWRIWPPLSVDRLQVAADCFQGRHDFGAFGSATRKGGGTVRTVSGSAWTVADEVLRYEIVAQGFLYRMVRRIVFVQVAAAQGRCSTEQVSRALRALRAGPALRASRQGDPLPAGLAPAHGLILMEVGY